MSGPSAHTPLERDEAASATLEAYWQASFEDSRHIAWLTAQSENHRTDAAAARTELDAARSQLAEQQAVADALRATISTLSAEVASIRASRSWRAAAPLRWIGRAARLVLGRR